MIRSPTLLLGTRKLVKCFGYEGLRKLKLAEQTSAISRDQFIGLSSALRHHNESTKHNRLPPIVSFLYNTIPQHLPTLFFDIACPYPSSPIALKFYDRYRANTIPNTW